MFYCVPNGKMKCCIVSKQKFQHIVVISMPFYWVFFLLRFFITKCYVGCGTLFYVYSTHIFTKGYSMARFFPLFSFINILLILLLSDIIATNVTMWLCVGCSPSPLKTEHKNMLKSISHQMNRTQNIHFAIQRVRGVCICM